MANILVVNDNQRVLRRMSSVLRGLGHTVNTAVDLAGGRRAAESISIDMLFSDKNLGGYWRGVIPLLTYMQEERPWVPVVITSAEDGRQARKELYCHDFIETSRPYIDYLRRVVGRFLPDYEN